MQSDESRDFDRPEFLANILGRKIIITPESEIGKKIAEGDYIIDTRKNTGGSGKYAATKGRNEYF